MSDVFDKEFLTKEVDIMKLINSEVQEENKVMEQQTQEETLEHTKEEVKKKREQNRDKKKEREKKVEREMGEEVLEEMDGKQAVISAKAMLANIDNNPGLSEEHKQFLKEATLRILMDFFKDKKIVFDEESYREFEKLEHKELLLRVKAFRDAVEEFNNPERKLGELLKEYDNIKELFSKVASLERELREVIVSVEGLKVKVEDIDGSLNDRISEIEARIEDMEKLRREIEELEREYVETNTPNVQVDEKWIEERVLKILRELEMQVGTDESVIRGEIERIVKEEVEKAVSQLQVRREEEKVKEEPRMEVLEEVGVIRRTSVSEERVQEKPKKKSLIAGVPDVVIYIVVALGLIFFVMQMLG